LFTPKLNVVFCGTPEFSIPTLSLLHHHPRVELKHIISMPDRPAGRGQQLKSPPVIEYAKKFQLPFSQTENLNKETSLIDSLAVNTDLIVVLAFAQFLNKTWLNLPKLGCFNIHTSLLPKYRGAAPIQYALLNGDQETGVSIQKMVSKMDAGNIVLEKKIAIREYEHTASLQTKLQYAAALALEELLDQLLNKKITEHTQDESQVSFAPEIPKEMGHIQFQNELRQNIINKLRGLSPKPGLYFFLNSKRIKLHDLEIPTAENLYNISPGEIKVLHQQLIVGCKDGPIRVTLLQQEGKEKTADHQFICGLRDQITITQEIVKGNTK
jgi:methionyl-tRNA formyltransferase